MENESILTSIKKMLGITEEYTHFDTDIIIHINSVFMILNQMGVGPSSGFIITDNAATWDEILNGSTNSEANLESVKTYVYLKVKLIFDPPLSSSVAEAMKQMISELEWRLNVQSELNRREENQNG